MTVSSTIDIGRFTHHSAIASCLPFSKVPPMITSTIRILSFQIHCRLIIVFNTLRQYLMSAFFFIFRFCRAMQHTAKFGKEVMMPYTYDLYCPVSRVFQNPSLFSTCKKESFNILCSFSITPRIYPLGFTFRKTKFSRKITSMIYTSNCILSKVVNETSVAAISTYHLSPAGVFSFVSLFFLVPVALKWAPAWDQAPDRSRDVTFGHPRRFCHQTRHHLWPGARHRVAPEAGARAFDGGASLPRRLVCLSAHSFERKKIPDFARIGIDDPLTSTFYNKLYNVNLNLQIHRSCVHSFIHFFFSRTPIRIHALFPSYHPL